MPPSISDELLASRDPARVTVRNGDRRRPRRRGPRRRVLDLATWVAPRRDDAALRPDGSHYEYDDDTGVAAELIRLVDDA